MHILQENTDDDSNATLSDSVVTIDHGGKVGIHSTSPETGLDILSDDGIFVRTVLQTVQPMVPEYNLVIGEVVIKEGTSFTNILIIPYLLDLMMVS